MRKLKPVENLLLDLICEDEKDILADRLWGKSSLPQTNVKAILAILKAYLKDDEILAICRHYHMNLDGEYVAHEAKCDILDEQVYFKAMSKLRHLDNPKDWEHLGWTLETLCWEVSALEEELSSYEKIIKDHKDWLVDIRHAIEWLVIQS